MKYTYDVTVSYRYSFNSKKEAYEFFDKYVGEKDVYSVWLMRNSYDAYGICMPDSCKTMRHMYWGKEYK